MSTFPYTTVLGKLSTFLKKIRDVGVPDKATYKWLESLGFKSKNDRSMISVIKFIGFANQQGVPTERWSQYRGGKSKKILAEGILEGYSELFATYPDACNRSNQELENFFSTRTSSGKQVIQKTVGTFKSLCDLADFSGEDKVKTKATGKSKSIDQPSKSIDIEEGVSFSPSIHIDIQIHISPETTSDQIDKIFSSMQKHIFKRE
jgi:hypothetical protein